MRSAEVYILWGLAGSELKKTITFWFIVWDGKLWPCADVQKQTERVRSCAQSKIRARDQETRAASWDWFLLLLVRCSKTLPCFGCVRDLPPEEFQELVVERQRFKTKDICASFFLSISSDERLVAQRWTLEVKGEDTAPPGVGLPSCEQPRQGGRATWESGKSPVFQCRKDWDIFASSSGHWRFLHWC